MSTSTELRLASHEALTRSLNDRVAHIFENSETFGPLTFMCECGIFDCGERIELTVDEYEAIRQEPTHFFVHPDHVSYAIEFVVLEYANSYAVVEKVGAAGRLAIATDPRADTDELLSRDSNGGRTRMTSTPSAEFHLHDTVRLLNQHGDIKSGTLGRILGWFLTEKPTYVVSFEGDTVRIVGDVRSEEVVLTGDLQALPPCRLS